MSDQDNVTFLCSYCEWSMSGLKPSVIAEAGRHVAEHKQRGDEKKWQTMEQREKFIASLNPSKN